MHQGFLTPNVHILKSTFYVYLDGVLYISAFSNSRFDLTVDLTLVINHPWGVSGDFESTVQALHIVMYKLIE